MTAAQQTLNFQDDDEMPQVLSPAACSVFSRNLLEMTEDLFAIGPGSPLDEWLDEEWEAIDRAQKDGIYRITPNTEVVDVSPQK